jgi:hypothetical protein
VGWLLQAVQTQLLRSVGLGPCRAVLLPQLLADQLHPGVQLWVFGGQLHVLVQQQLPVGLGVGSVCPEQPVLLRSAVLLPDCFGLLAELL